MTTVGTTLAANSLQNYYNILTIEDRKIKSMARGTYLTGTNGSISFGAGTNYTISTSGNNIRITYRSGWTTYNMTQTSSTAVGMTSSTSNRNWNLLPVTYDIP
jgi:hypothetical protein